MWPSHLSSAKPGHTFSWGLQKGGFILTAVVMSVAVFSTSLPAAEARAADTKASKVGPQDLGPLPADPPEKAELTIPEGDMRGGSTPDGYTKPSTKQKSLKLTDAQRNEQRGQLVDHTETADIYRMPNGSMMAEQHSTPVNKRDRNGNWSKINTRNLRCRR